MKISAKVTCKTTRFIILEYIFSECAQYGLAHLFCTKQKQFWWNNSEGKFPLSRRLGSSSSRGPARNIQKSSLHKIFFSLSSISLRQIAFNAQDRVLRLRPQAFFSGPAVHCILVRSLSDLWQDYCQFFWQAPKQAWVEWIIVWRPGSCRVLPPWIALTLLLMAATFFPSSFEYTFIV